MLQWWMDGQQRSSAQRVVIGLRCLRYLGKIFHNLKWQDAIHLLVPHASNLPARVSWSFQRFELSQVVHEGTADQCNASFSQKEFQGWAIWWIHERDAQKHGLCWVSPLHEFFWAITSLIRVRSASSAETSSTWSGWRHNGQETSG